MCVSLLVKSLINYFLSLHFDFCFVVVLGSGKEEDDTLKKKKVNRPVVTVQRVLEDSDYIVICTSLSEMFNC